MDRILVKKVISTVLACVAFILLFQTIALAYSIIPGSANFSSGGKVTYKYTKSGTYDYDTTVFSAVTNWNYSGANVSISKITSGTPHIAITSNSYGNTNWHGLAYPPAPAIRPNSATISLNDYYYTAVGSNRTELVAHELGHVFRLDESSSSAVLMYGSGYRGSALPQQDDINGVNANYK